MRRPIVFSSALAAALAGGALLGAPTAHADGEPEPSGSPGAPPVEAPTRTGRADDAPPAPSEPTPAAPVEAPRAVRTGRVGDVPEPAATDPAPPESTPEQTPDSAPASTRPESDRTPPAGAPNPAPADRPSDPSAPGAPTPAVPGAVPAPPAAALPAPPVPTTHTIEPGENLWEIAAAHLAVATGRPRAALTPLEIAPYWTRICLANRPHLASGDVDLVYPGEVLELPQP